MSKPNEEVTELKGQLSAVEQQNRELLRELEITRVKAGYLDQICANVDTARTRITQVANRSNDDVVRYALLFIAHDMQDIKTSRG
jgi:flagellin-like hook-associated protein FlgL